MATEFFGGARCALVAAILDECTLKTWIFSICSDERIPLELENRLCNLREDELPSRLVIIGDFPTTPPQRSPASYEAIRLVSKAAGEMGKIEVCWLNGEEINLSNNYLPPLNWYEFHAVYQQGEGYVRQIELPQNSSERDACLKIISILGELPRMSLSVDGSVDSLNLTEGENYPRSLMAKLAGYEKEMLWSQIKRLTYLRELRVGFSGLRDFPDISHLKSLEFLDLRGNPGLKLENVLNISSLKKLNLAACDLDSIPSQIDKLLNLKSLLLYKNRICNISNTKFPAALERISLYRNQIKAGDLDLSKNQVLTELNFGANPLESLTLSISGEVNSLKLRLRFVKGKVAIKWRGQLGIEPAIITED